MLTITVEHLSRGAQPRPYAPHTYEARITFRAPVRNELPLEDHIRTLVKALICPFKEEAELAEMDSMSAHFSAHLRHLGMEAETAGVAEQEWTQTWKARVEIPFTD